MALYASEVWENIGVQLLKSDHRAGLQPEVPEEFAVEEGGRSKRNGLFIFHFKST